MKLNFAIVVLSLLLCVLALESFLRLTHEAPQYPKADSEHLIWERSAELGWSGAPNVETNYSNGYFSGQVTTDQHGNRKNSSSGTYKKEYRTMLFIGDSTSASLEVDDDQTVPALLEAALRERGLKINIVNLGVRGYGTDQSVRKALLHAKWYPPEQIIYMFTDNDFFDNNVIRQPFRKFGKGIYLPSEQGEFTSYNYPVPEYPAKFYGAVVLNNSGAPQLFKGTNQPDRPAASSHWSAKLNDSIEETLHVYRIFRSYRRGTKVDQLKHELSDWPDRPENPYEVINSARGNVYDVFFALSDSLTDGGYGRRQHRQYYDSQFEALLKLLRQIPTVTDVHLVEFPSTATLGLMKNGQESTNSQLFGKLLTDKVIDGYVNLNAALEDQQISLSSLTCREDGHFCEKGNGWVAEAILEQLPF